MKGQKAIIKTALFLIDYFQEKILNSSNFEEIYSILNQENLP